MPQRWLAQRKERAEVDGAVHHAGHPGHVEAQEIDTVDADVPGRGLRREPEVEHEVGENIVGIDSEVVGGGDVDAGVLVADDDVVGDGQRAAVDDMHRETLLGVRTYADAHKRGQQETDESFIHHDTVGNGWKLILEASNGHLGCLRIGVATSCTRGVRQIEVIGTVAVFFCTPKICTLMSIIDRITGAIPGRVCVKT